MAIKIPIGNGLCALIDDDDYELVSRFKWHVHKSGGSDTCYASSNIKMHRLITCAPLGIMVDHINGDRLDNRKENLRFCSNAQNQQNTQSRGGSSRYKGVSFSAAKKKWQGMFAFEGVNYYCGTFVSEEECARAVDKKRLEVCGEFAVLNIKKTSVP